MRTMNIKILSIILSVTCIYNAEANNRNTRQLRSGRRYFNQHDNVMCSYVSPQVYETMVVSKIQEILYLATKRAVKGACSMNDICKSLCMSYDTFTVTSTQCQCQMEATPRTTTILTDAAVPTTATTVAPVTTKAPSQSPITKKPTISPTAAPIVTSTTTTNTKTEFCSNPYGNPCGPGSACTDTETGISCAPINVDGCPVGCGPNSTCQLQQQQSYECVCNAGYSRPQPYLPCVANP